jgi:hypothetical protein
MSRQLISNGIGDLNVCGHRGWLPWKRVKANFLDGGRLPKVIHGPCHRPGSLLDQECRPDGETAEIHVKGRRPGGYPDREYRLDGGTTEM